MGASRSVVEAFYDAFSRGDFEAALATVADDIQNVDPSGTIQGREAFGQFIRGFKDAIPDARLSARGWIEDGDMVADEGLFVGTFTGPLQTPAGEVSPTGAAFELPFAEINRIEDGRIKEHRVYYDQMTFMRLLGLMPST